MDSKRGVCTVASPGFAGVCGYLKEAGGEFSLGDVSISSQNEYATIGVVAMDGQMISNSDDLVQAIRAAKPGSDTELSYYVGDKLARKSVKLAPAN